MSEFHIVESRIWEELINVTAPQKLLYLYFYSNASCRPSGLYHINPKSVKLYTGAGPSGIRSICGDLIEYDFDTSEVFVVRKLERFLPGFEANPALQKSVKQDFEKTKSGSLKDRFYFKYEGAMRGPTGPILSYLLVSKDLDSEREDRKEGKQNPEATPPTQPKVLSALWNEVCRDFPKVKEISTERTTKCQARLRERSVDQWREVFERVQNSDFLKGQNARGWKASFDWIIANDHNSVKVLEGKYDSKRNKPSVEGMLKEVFGG